jgi:heme/copper-type cytochrome/quinol oxidase subunit 2
VTEATRNKGNKNKDKNKVPKSKRTKILWTVIPIVVICLSVWLVLAYGPSPATPPNSNNSSGAADRVDVAYFHRTQQCYSCRYAEEGTRHTVETYFKDELTNGKVTFQSVDVQDEANTEIADKYGAYTSSLFINAVKDGNDNIEQVTDIWLVIGDDEAFVELVKGRIEKSLNGET